MLTSICIKNYV